VEFVLLYQQLFSSVKRSAVISTQGRTTNSNSVNGRFLCVRIWTVFREASTKSLFHSFITPFQKTIVVNNDFQEMPQIMPFAPPSAACNMPRLILMGMMLWFNVFEMSWSQITITKYGCTKQAMRWRIWFQHFFFCTIKSTRYESSCHLRFFKM